MRNLIIILLFPIFAFGQHTLQGKSTYITSSGDTVLCCCCITQSIYQSTQNDFLLPAENNPNYIWNGVKYVINFDTLSSLQIEKERLKTHERLKTDSLNDLIRSLTIEKNHLKWQLNDMEDKRAYWMQSSKRYEAAFNKRGELQERDNRIIELKSDIIRILQEEIEKLKKQ